MVDRTNLTPAQLETHVEGIFSRFSGRTVEVRDLTIEQVQIYSNYLSSRGYSVRDMATTTPKTIDDPAYLIHIGRKA
jgi:hypothetical protein